MAFPVLSANVKDFGPDLPQKQANHEIALTGSQARGGVILWQEVKKSPDESALRRIPGFDHYVNDKVESSTPISWDESWHCLKRETHVLHAGLAKWSLGRHITVVVLSKKRGGPVAFVNTHFIPGVWVPGQDKHGLSEARERYLTGKENLNRVVRGLMREGLPIIGGGDYNRKQYLDPKVVGPMLKVGDKYRRAVSYHTPRNSIDHLWTVNGEYRNIKVKSLNTMARRYTDHDARRMVVSMRPRIIGRN